MTSSTSTSPTPTIDDRRFFTTVRLDGDASRATGFLVERADAASGEPRVFIATARHAFENTDGLTIRLIAADDDGRPNLGRHHVVELGSISGMWVGHPDDGIDLAVLAFDDILDAVDAPTVLELLSTDRFHTGDSLAQLPAISEVTILGYPSGISDPAHTTPLARRGHTATPPALDYSGDAAFLIDASVFAGSSGSPVFSEPPTSTPDFLGVVVKAKATAATEEADAPGERLEMLDLGVVYKPSALLEVLDAAVATSTS